MEIILLENVERLGQLGDVVDVRPGYARNFLIPQGKARYATAENLKEVEARRAELEKQAAANLAAAEARCAPLRDLAVTIPVETNADGNLFGSVGPSEIAAAVAATGCDLERREVRLPDGPLQTPGLHLVTVHIAEGVETQLQVTVEPSGMVAVDPEDTEEVAPEAAAEPAPAEMPEAPAETEKDA